jgi:hypothetical protein
MKGFNIQLASSKEVEKRLEICKKCDRYNTLGICKECGCLVKFKARLKNKSCPLGKH